MLRALVVDDEAPARLRLVDMLAEMGDLVEVAGEAADGKTAVRLVEELHPDIVLLDVQMPGLDGFDVVDLLQDPRPHIVFTTAYEEHALRAFEVHALDYLTKPVRRPRLRQTLERVKDLVGRRDDALDAPSNARRRRPLERLTMRIGRRLQVVDIAQIHCLEAEDKLVFAHVGAGRHVVDFTLKELEERLDSEVFLRVHRAFLVHIDAIRELVPWVAGGYQIRLESGAMVPVARRRVSAIKRLLGGR
jgi:two-component system, LytTR family, response regulator